MAPGSSGKARAKPAHRDARRACYPAMLEGVPVMHAGSAKGSRNTAIDFARGVAVLLMVQTHAYDGWVTVGARATLSFRLTRFLGVLPLPLFLVLAGVGVALRTTSGLARGEPPNAIRRDLFQRGAKVVLAGFVVSLLLGLIDGARDPATYLRIDVLHAIGLSIILASVALVREPSGETTDGRVDARHAATLTRRSIALGVALTVATVPATLLGRGATGPLRVLLAPWVEVPGITRMPVIPLAVWLCAGVVFATTWLRRDRSASEHFRVFAIASLISAVAWCAMTITHEAIGGPLDRAHPAVVFNLVDLGARALAVVTLTLATFMCFPVIARRVAPVLALGRHSLLAYAVHLPFAYGAIPRRIARSLPMPEATGFLLLLAAGTYFVVVVVDRVERARAAQRPERVHSSEGTTRRGDAL